MPKTRRISHMWTEAKFKLGQWSTVFIFFNYPFKVIQKEISRVWCIFGPCFFQSSSETQIFKSISSFWQKNFFLRSMAPTLCMWANFDTGNHQRCIQGNQYFLLIVGINQTLEAVTDYKHDKTFLVLFLLLSSNRNRQNRYAP